MAIESSGAISLGTTAGAGRSISAEWGGSAPHALSEYYDKGNAPSSGEIQMGADFHGTTATNYDDPRSAYTLDSYTVCLIRAAGGTISDVSSAGHSLTINGAVASATETKHHSHSIYFDGVDDFLRMNDHSDWFMGTGHYTVDFWVKWESDIGDDGYGQCGLFGQQTGVSNGNYRSALFKTSAVSGLWWYDTEPNEYGWDGNGSGGGYPGQFSNTWSGESIEDGEWHHIAIVYYYQASSGSGNVMNMYLNGVGGSVNSTYRSKDNSTSNPPTTAYDADDYRPKDNTNKMYIGECQASNATTGNWHGYMDEIRFSKGIRRWTSNFTTS